MTAHAISHQITLETIECCECRVTFAMPNTWKADLIKTGNWFYCPAGHQQRYTESENTRLRKMLEEANRSKTELVATNQRLIEAKNNLWDEKKKVEVQLKRTKTIAKKVTERIHAGVCPCCNRTFTNLARHMQTKHKDQKP